MLAAFLIVGFFISVTACLRFSAWAESWLVPGKGPLRAQGHGPALSGTPAAPKQT